MGQRIFGAYRATKLLARTEYADVYEADNDGGQRFAVKVLRLDGVEAALVDALPRRTSHVRLVP